MNLQQLFEQSEHDCYCSDNNYYDSSLTEEFKTWDDFLSYMEDADEDFNLLFRWDISRREEEDDLSMSLFFVQQRKGRFVPMRVRGIKEEDVESIVVYLKGKWKKVCSLWVPFSNSTF